MASPIMTRADMYGKEAKRVVGANDVPTAQAASGSIGDIHDDSNQSMSWLALVAILVLIRLFEMSLPNG